MTTGEEVPSEGPYDLTPAVHSRYFVLPVSAAILGTLIGGVRGSRQASLRFLAENAHRPPTTVQGWYFYNKTKNYRRMAAGLREGGKNALGLGMAALVWVGIEDGLERCGQPWAGARELGAGLGTASVFAGACECMCSVERRVDNHEFLDRLPWRTGCRAMCLGGIVGGGMGLLRWAKSYLEAVQSV